MRLKNRKLFLLLSYRKNKLFSDEGLLLPLAPNPLTAAFKSRENSPFWPLSCLLKGGYAKIDTGFSQQDCPLPSVSAACVGRLPWTLTSAFRSVPRLPRPPPERRRRVLASCLRERVRREWEWDCPEWKWLPLRREPAVLLAAHELVFRRAAPSLGRPRSLCFPRDRPTPRRGGGSPSRRLPCQRLRRAATLEAGAAASERRSPSGGGGGQQHEQRRRAGSRPATWRAPRTTFPICWKKWHPATRTSGEAEIRPSAPLGVPHPRPWPSHRPCPTPLALTGCSALRRSPGHPPLPDPGRSLSSPTF